MTASKCTRKRETMQVGSIFVKILKRISDLRMINCVSRALPDAAFSGRSYKVDCHQIPGRRYVQYH